jgi:prephenate dehydrogenase
MSLETIGIVGCNGNLGSQMAIQACSQSPNVIGFDISSDATLTVTGVNPKVTIESAVGTMVRTSSLSELMQECDIVHWCAPSHTTTDITNPNLGALVILHDSVMATSLESAKTLTDRIGSVGRLAIAHCLMNTHNRVVIASDFGDSAAAQKHLTELGLEPRLMTVQQHDHAMAHSQAVLAVLVKSLLPELQCYDQKGLLTNSAHELLRSLQHREAVWTEATMATMLANPELPQLIDTLSTYVADHQKTK